MDRVSSRQAVLAAQGNPKASIVIGEHCPPFYGWVGREIQRFVRKLSGAELPVITPAESTQATGSLVLVGPPEANRLTASVQKDGQVDFSGLKPDGFLLKSVVVDHRHALIVGGLDERSTMYAAYDLLERLGMVFQFTGDILPQRKPDLSLPSLDVRQEPAIKYRGFHVRHFVMPWMGLDYFRKLVDQLAKLKCNYLEFFWYIGAPWIEYAYRGEQKLIGDLYPRESGYTAWRSMAGTFTPADVVIGKEHFPHARACAPEFQHCDSPQEAYAAARHLLQQMIQCAHERRIEIWLGMGDCPSVPPNLGRFAKRGKWERYFGRVIPPGDPVGLEIWTNALNSMIESYPDADGYWVWLAENYYHAQDPETAEVLRQYDDIRQLIPDLAEIREMGYDQYFEGMTQQCQVESDLGLLHYGKSLAQNTMKRHPRTRLGVSVLGRSYLFPALDAVLPAGVAIQSMEASICWNRGSRVPMGNFKAAGGRETFLVPRLDDDGHELAMQFNVGLYHHDCVLSGSSENGVPGIAPQVGKTRGLEQNARFLTEGAWNTSLAPEQFYQIYVTRLFGPNAADLMLKAYRSLEENEMFLGLHVDTKEAGPCFLGIGNFLNFADSGDIELLKLFGQQEAPLEGPHFPAWNVNERGESEHLRRTRYRLDRFKAAVENLEKVLDYLYQARPLSLPGSQLVPGLYQYADVGHVMGAIASRPLLIESGTSDMCFEFHSARQAHDIVRKIYRAAGADDQLEIDAFPGGHAFAANKAFSFFARHLQNPPADTKPSDVLDGTLLANGEARADGERSEGQAT